MQIWYQMRNIGETGDIYITSMLPWPIVVSIMEKQGIHAKLPVTVG